MTTPYTQTVSIVIPCECGEFTNGAVRLEHGTEPQVKSPRFCESCGADLSRFHDDAIDGALLLAQEGAA